MKGELVSAAREYTTGKVLMTFRVEPGEELPEIDKALEIAVKQWRERRSLSQNDYYWTLIGKMMKVLKVGRYELHNRLLAEYGQEWTVGDKVAYVVLPDDEETERKVAHDPENHLRPTHRRTEKGWRVYHLLRGSRTYNTEEMSLLLDGAIEEAKELGIETMTPDELERIRAHERQAEERKQGKAEG